MKPYIIGMDIGGTNIRVAMGVRGESLQHFQRIHRQTVLSGEMPVKRLGTFIRTYIHQYGTGASPTAVVIGFPATLDKNRRRIVQAPNIPGLDGLSADELEQELGVPVYLEKDVNLLFACDRADLNVPDRGLSVGIYVGTGIGNAICYDGIPFSGKNGAAGELGHIPHHGASISCGCGNLDCAECSASGRYLTWLRDTRFPDTCIQNLFLEHGNSPELEAFLENLACVIATELNILDPEYLVLGGGVLHMEGFPFERLTQRILLHTRKPYPAEGLQILCSKDGVENGVRGAVAMGWHWIDRKACATS